MCANLRYEPRVVLNLTFDHLDTRNLAVNTGFSSIFTFANLNLGASLDASSANYTVTIKCLQCCSSSNVIEGKDVHPHSLL